MKMLGKLIYDEGIKSIVEYGTGLSTELLSFFVDDIVSYDEFEKHSLYYSRLKTLCGKVKFVRY
ncbi:MAG: hypothetical protein IIB08_04435, partial [Bacteroidetes bacterium]|nr:hypothetical protein [Bacteroidota bacterium]